MGKYKCRLKGNYNYYKEIEIEAENEKEAYYIANKQSCDLLNKIISLIEQNKDIKHFMSYYDVKIKEKQNETTI